jgi:hypothetical protein
MHYYSFVVVVVQSEETGNWSIDLQLAFSAAHSADLGEN